MFQWVTKSGEDLTRSGQFYYLQAIPEYAVSRALTNPKLVAVVRGLPASAQCSPVAATCFICIHDKALSVLRKRYDCMTLPVPNRIITIMMTTIPHFLKRRTSPLMHTTKNNMIPHHLVPLPDDVAQIDEPVAFVV